VNAVAPLPASGAKGGEIELSCPNGHRTMHSLARVLRLNDAWCGKCGADIRYDASAEPGREHAGRELHVVTSEADKPEPA
jgi:hypothetical protein